MEQNVTLVDFLALRDFIFYSGPMGSKNQQEPEKMAWHWSYP